MPWNSADRVIRINGRPLKEKREEFIRVLNSIKEKKMLVDFVQPLFQIDKETREKVILTLDKFLAWAEEIAETKANVSARKR